MHEALERVLRLAAIGSLIMTAAACHHGPGGSPTDGQMVGSVYTNRYFGLSLAIPAGWTAGELKPMFVAPKNSPQPDAATLRDEPAHQLLMVSEKPLGTAGGAKGSLLIMAERMAGIPGVKTAKDYLARTSKLLIDAPVAYHPVAGIGEMKLGNVPAHRLDFTARLAQNQLARQSYVVCERYGYALSFIVSGSTAEDVQRAEQALKGIKFD